MSPLLLVPAACNSDFICHRNQLFFGVGQHVAHGHAPISSLHIINVDRHRSARLSRLPAKNVVLETNPFALLDKAPAARLWQHNDESPTIPTLYSSHTMQVFRRKGTAPGRTVFRR